MIYKLSVGACETRRDLVGVLIEESTDQHAGCVQLIFTRVPKMVTPEASILMKFPPTWNVIS